MINKNIIKSDPFWEENSKLSVEEIEKNFPKKIAEALKNQKQSKNFIEN